jgi:hypothetical protein
MKIAIFKEKYGDRYFDVSTPEKEFDVYLKIAKQRIKDGYWYDTDCLMPNEPEISKEQIVKMKDSGLKTAAIQEWRNYEANLSYVKECEQTEKLIKLVKKGDKQAAKTLIQNRRDGEYEGFEIEETEN